MNRQTKRLLAAALVVGLGWLAQQAGLDLGALGALAGSSSSSLESSLPRPSARDAAAPTTRAQRPASRPPATSDALRRVEAAVAARESGFMVTLDARVTKNLRDDLEGSRHQRFLIELENGRSLLVAHNIDLADRIELREGAPVRVRGQYEWNAKGGVIHWTHHDPDGRHPGGWIEANGRRVE